MSGFFQFDNIPVNHIVGDYDIRFIILSYLASTFASYIALDLTAHLRNDNKTMSRTILWLLVGTVAMSVGIWSMNFIGILAFHIPHLVMNYDSFLLILSLVITLLASGFTLLILRVKNLKPKQYVFCGSILGIAIISMHYCGLAAMKINMSLHYLPSLFILSIIIAISASTTALWLAIKSNQVELKKRFQLKALSAGVMGAGICGMHYIGLAGTIFIPSTTSFQSIPTIDHHECAIIIAGCALIILGFAYVLSDYQLSLNQGMLESARKSGMAEIARNVLHNIGNVLNSVNVSVDVLSNTVTSSKLSGLADINNLISVHKDNLCAFLTQDPKGAVLADYLAILANEWQKEREQILNEIKTLTTNIQHINSIISEQEALSKVPSLQQVTAVDLTIEEAFSFVNFQADDNHIIVEKKYNKIKPILIDREKLLQVLIKLMKNSKSALLSSPNPKKHLSIELMRYKDEQDQIIIKIEDNGIGISSENLNLIFSQRFETKEDSHLMLHSSINAAKEMGGNISILSVGEHKGTTVTLSLPYRLPK